MIKLQGCSNRNYVVLGLGRSGTASVEALVASGANVICWDDCLLYTSDAADE